MAGDPLKVSKGEVAGNVEADAVLTAIEKANNAMWYAWQAGIVVRLSVQEIYGASSPYPVPQMAVSLLRQL